MLKRGSFLWSWWKVWRELNPDWLAHSNFERDDNEHYVISCHVAEQSLPPRVPSSEQFSTMLSPLRGKGLSHRSVVPSVLFISLFYSFFRRYHQLSRHRRHVSEFGSTRATLIAPISTSSSNALHLYRRRTTHSQTFLLPSRSFSTPPTTTSEPKDAPSPHTIHPAPHKAKVELRPGPIKQPIAPSSSQSSKSKKIPTTNPSPQPHPTSSIAKPSNIIAETMKEDMKQAYIHGILARPPPGAGKVATLWHQAKELFVG